MLVYGRSRTGWKKTRMTELAARLRSVVRCPVFEPRLEPGRMPRVEIRRKRGVVVITRMQFLDNDQLSRLSRDAEYAYLGAMGFR